ncbi:MAG TPA: SGNH/GDSL hydrolase family protein, partial [Pseudonocardiaceae bacterium]|nr:SGNH/GDSL hydrolase family protein [Pseudonocardiaceae bacterium]
MKVPLSRSEGGGGGLLVRAFGTAAIAAVLAISTGTAQAGAAEPSAGPAAPATSASAKPTLKVVVIGDSFTSGEGASSSTYKTVPVRDVNQDGIDYTSMQVDPAHQSSTAPSLQALNQIQAANPGVDLQVTFVPVSGATRDSLYQTTRPGTPFEQPPQIDAVKGADVVIVGIGGNDARFSDWVHTALTSTDATSTQQFPQFMEQFNNGTYLNNQVKLLNDISNLASPNATIVSLGYPKAMPATVPGEPVWWSPFSWSQISQGEANMSNQLATTLNTNNQDASFIAASQHPAQQWLYADLSTALEGHELFTSQEGLNGLTPGNVQGSYHPNDLGQQLLGATMQPYIQQAVNGQLQRLGVQGAEDVPTVTPTFSSMWNLRVDLPLQMQKLQQLQQSQQAPPTDDKSQAPPAQDTQQQPSDQPSDQATPAQPEGAQPKPDAAPEGPKPDVAPQDGPQPEGTQPKPDAAQPDAAQPDTAQPDTAAPDGSGAAQPDGADLARPTAAGSDGAQPDAASP